MISFATDEEIRAAHDVMLPGKPDFEEDKLAVIRCNESRDIKACPGSGKTTVLLAKLSILSNRMPFADGSGICVLTHTNVAIDEIKARFGGKADLLFSYPNYCGTIQSFVDRYLTIPLFNSFSDKPLVDVNDDRAIIKIKKEFWSRFRQLDKAKKKSLYSLVEIENYKRGGVVNWDAVHAEIESVVLNSYYDFYTRRYYRHYGDNKSIAAKAVKQGEDSPRFSFLEVVRRTAQYEGILKYEDAYSIAFTYCSLLPGIRDSISARFNYVFIDEVQDSNKLQLDLLDMVFNRERVVVQRFGDPFQAIYNTEGDCAWTPVNPLPLNKSKRFGDAIATVLKTVCIEDNKELEGNEAVRSVKPIMMVYTDGMKVLPDFAKLLKEKKIDGVSIADIAGNERKADTLHRINIKAVGYVGKEKVGDDGESQSIHYYFPQFENQKTTKQPFVEEVTLNTFLQKNAVKDNPQEYRNHILDALVSVLVRADVRKDNGRTFSKTSMMEFLEVSKPDVYVELIEKLSEWVLKISNSEYRVDGEVFEDVKSFISTDFASIFDFSAGIGVIRHFLKKKDDDFYHIKNAKQSFNVYRDGELEIEVATVHSVKGETHAATLFLETKNYKYESEHFGAQLCGAPYVHRSGEGHVLPSLKVAYVALSRPKYLLAYAIHKDRFDILDRDKLEKIWDIREVE